MQDGLTLSDEGNRAMLRLRKTPASTRGFAELRALYQVQSGSDLTANDDEFYVALFDDELWVLPVDTPGLNQVLFGAWYEPLCSAERFFGAALEVIPLAWRRRFLGLLPLPSPRLGVHPAGDLPDWQVSGPLDFSELPRPTL